MVLFSTLTDLLLVLENFFYILGVKVLFKLVTGCTLSSDFSISAAESGWSWVLCCMGTERRKMCSGVIISSRASRSRV